MKPIKLVEIGIVRDAADPDSDEVTEAITTPADVLGYLKDLRDKDREHFVCLHLDSRNRVTSMETVAVGTLNASLVHPREVFKAAILANAASVIVAHNHPSADVTPSSEDIALTKRLMEAGEILGIEVLDHIVVGGERFTSCKEANLF